MVYRTRMHCVGADVRYRSDRSPTMPPSLLSNSGMEWHNHRVKNRVPPCLLCKRYCKHTATISTVGGSQVRTSCQCYSAERRANSVPISSNYRSAPSACRPQPPTDDASSRNEGVGNPVDRLRRQAQLPLSRVFVYA